MRFTNINILTRVVVASAIFAFAGGSATAATISGDLSFSADIDTGTADMSTATGFVYLGGDIDADTSNGDFGGIAQGDTGSATSFDFMPFVSSSVALGGFTITFDSATVAFQNDAAVLMVGTGTVTGNGFDPTGFTYSASATQSGPLQNFSVALETVPVPVPGALVLLVSALGVLGIRRR